MRTRYSSLSDFLKRTGTKQADFAARVGVTQPVISRIVNGQTPRLALALRIAKAAQVPVASLLTDARSSQSAA